MLGSLATAVLNTPFCRVDYMYVVLSRTRRNEKQHQQQNHSLQYNTTNFFPKRIARVTQGVHKSFLKNFHDFQAFLT